MAADGDSRSWAGGILALAAVVAAPFTGGTSLAWLPAALAVTGAVLSYTGARIQYKEAQERARQAQNGRAFKTNITGGAESHFLLLGQERVGGIVVAAGVSGTGGSTLHLGIAHSITHGGGAEGIGDVYLNEVRIAAADFTAGAATVAPFAGFLSYEFHPGLDSPLGTAQAVDSTLVAASIDSSTDHRGGIAWSRFTLVRDMNSDENFRKAFPSGIPTISVVMKGVRVYDPRQDTANGGSGAHRYADPTTWRWTGGGGSVNALQTGGADSIDVGRNPALCAATYMIMAEKDGGMGYDPTRINWASVAAAATICEELIAIPNGGGTVNQRRYRCDCLLSTADKRSDNLEFLLASMQGTVVRVGDRFYMYAGAADAISATITEDWLRGQATFSTKDPIDSLYNSVRVTHNDATPNTSSRPTSYKDYRSDETAAFLGSTQSPNYETQDGGIRLWRDVNLRGVSDSYGAQYIAAIIGRKSRFQRSLELPLNMRGLQLRIWDTVNVTIAEFGLSAVKFRILGWTWEEAGPKVQLREESDTVYSAATVTYTNTLPSGVLTENIVLPAPVLTAASVADGVALTFTTPPVSTYKVLEIWRGGSSGAIGTKSLIATVAPGTTDYKDPVTTGNTLYYQVRVQSLTYIPGTASNEASAKAKVVDDGADVTSDELPGLVSAIQNPGFEAGDVSWTKVSPWTISFDASNARKGNYVASIAVATTIKSLTNLARLPVQVGDNVVAWAFGRADSSAASRGTFNIRISWVDLNDTQVTTSVGNIVSPTTSWTQSRIAIAVPANAGIVAAKLQIISNGNGSAAGTWYADDAYMVGVQKNLDEVPDGTSYAKALLAWLSSGKPIIDFLNTFHLNRVIDSMPAGTLSAILASQLSPSTFEHWLTIDGTASASRRIGNLFNLIAAANLGNETLLPNTGTTILTSTTDAGGNATIILKNFTRKLGSRTVSYTGVTASGLSASTIYWVYTDDPTYAGGIGSGWNFNASADTAFQGADGRIIVGWIQTAAASGTAASLIPAGKPGGSGFCVAADQWMTGTRRARDMQQNDLVRCRSDKGEFFMHPIERIHLVDADCVELLTEYGAKLVCSIHTPFTLPDGSSLRAPDMEKQKVLVQRGMNRKWETVIDISHAGTREVARIELGGNSYPAGASPQALIFSHNPAKP